MISQKTQGQIFNEAVDAGNARFASTLHQLLKVTRAYYIGNVAGTQMGPGGPQRVNIPGYPSSTLKFRQRLAERGTAAQVAAELTEYAKWKTALENTVNAALVTLGGASNVNPSGDWGFCLEYTGSNGTYLMPSIPFTTPTQVASGQTVQCTVDIDLSAGTSGPAVPKFTMPDASTPAIDPI